MILFVGFFLRGSFEDLVKLADRWFDSFLRLDGLWFGDAPPL
jgi:hypothetical protein